VSGFDGTGEWPLSKRLNILEKDLVHQACSFMGARRHGQGGHVPPEMF